MRSTFLILAAWIVSAAAPQTVSAQELEATVTLSTDQLTTSEARENLQGFKEQLEAYINSYTWSDEDLGGEKIACTFSVSITGSPATNQYTAQVFIGSQRPIYGSQRSSAVLRLLDDQWEFAYSPAQQFLHDNTRFSPLLSFIDFYCYLIVAFDFDSYKHNAGSPYFQKAMNVVNLARAAGGGWEATSPNIYSRGQLIDELLSPLYADYREAVQRYYYKGLDLLYHDKGRARANMLAALQKIGAIPRKTNQPSQLVKTFFETAYLEIAEVFKEDDDPSIFARLAEIDPAHRQTYLQIEQSRQ